MSERTPDRGGFERLAEEHEPFLKAIMAVNVLVSPNGPTNHHPFDPREFLEAERIIAAYVRAHQELFFFDTPINLYQTAALQVDLPITPGASFEERADTLIQRVCGDTERNRSGEKPAYARIAAFLMLLEHLGPRLSDTHFFQNACVVPMLHPAIFTRGYMQRRGVLRQDPKMDGPTEVRLDRLIATIARRFGSTERRGEIIFASSMLASLLEEQNVIGENPFQMNMNPEDKIKRLHTLDRLIGTILCTSMQRWSVEDREELVANIGTTLKNTYPAFPSQAYIDGGAESEAQVLQFFPIILSERAASA